VPGNRNFDDVVILPSKRMRNKIDGYTTHHMRRIAKGPVRLQEEELERRLDFVPEVSALEQETTGDDPKKTETTWDRITGPEVFKTVTNWKGATPWRWCHFASYRACS
jgi:hypothetical protein